MGDRPLSSRVSFVDLRDKYIMLYLISEQLFIRLLAESDGPQKHSVNSVDFRLSIPLPDNTSDVDVDSQVPEKDVGPVTEVPLTSSSRRGRRRQKVRHNTPPRYITQGSPFLIVSWVFLPYFLPVTHTLLSRIRFSHSHYPYVPCTQYPRLRQVPVERLPSVPPLRYLLPSLFLPISKLTHKLHLSYPSSLQHEVIVPLPCLFIDGHCTRHYPLYVCKGVN